MQPAAAPPSGAAAGTHPSRFKGPYEYRNAHTAPEGLIAAEREEATLPDRSHQTSIFAAMRDTVAAIEEEAKRR